VGHVPKTTGHSASSSDLLLINDIKGNIKEEKIIGGHFIPPTLDEIKQYCKDRKNTVNPEKWMAHYESNGWKVGRNSMKDWKAAVRTWENESVSKPTIHAKTMWE
jgi:hypothetical protein